MSIDELTLKLLEDLGIDIDDVDYLEEKPKRTSRTTVSRQTKIKRATGQLSSAAARKRNDPLYKRMVHYRELYFKYRNMIHKKYSPRVRSQARR
jgi:hypothetical protein